MMDAGTNTGTRTKVRAEHERRERLAVLKRRVQQGTYVIDTRLLAAAMLIEAGVGCARAQ